MSKIPYTHGSLIIFTKSRGFHRIQAACEVGYLRHPVPLVTKVPAHVAVYESQYSLPESRVKVLDHADKSFPRANRLIRQTLERVFKPHVLDVCPISNEVDLLAGIAEFLEEGEQVVDQRHIRLYLSYDADDLFELLLRLVVEFPGREKSPA